MELSDYATVFPQRKMKNLLLDADLLERRPLFDILVESTTKDSDIKSVLASMKELGLAQDHVLQYMAYKTRNRVYNTVYPLLFEACTDINMQEYLKSNEPKWHRENFYICYMLEQWGL